MKMPRIVLAALAGWWTAGSPAPPPVQAACTGLRGANKWFASETPWTSRNHQLYYGADAFELKGINWHGMESECRLVHGLWKNTLDFYLGLLREQKFNALRVPLSFEIMENLDVEVNGDCALADPAVVPGMTVGQFLHMFLDKLQSQGLFVLFDLHTIQGEITEMPWTPGVSEDRVIAAWTHFARTFGKHAAILGFEIKNEPHGRCTTPDFHAHAARVIQSIGSTFDGLFFIDGTAASAIDNPPWGGSFETIAQHCEDDALCALGIPSRIVLAPHVYGPDVRGLEVSEESSAVFERRYGFLKTHPFFNTSAILVTEFGGSLQHEDYDYFLTWKAFSQAKSLGTGAFFWTLPPSSADTGGILLDDYQTINTQKLDFLNSLQPSPSTPCA